jgi:hypothetical protein
VRSLLLLAGLAVLGGCPPPAEDIIIVDERFEEPIAARWTVSGSVQAVETYHPGEHGAQFASATTMSTPMVLAIYDELSDGNWLEYSSSCGGAPELWLVELEIEHYELHIALPHEPDDTAAEFERIHANLPPVPLPNDSSTTSPSIDRLVLEVYQGGPCILDNLLIVRPEPEYGW